MYTPNLNSVSSERIKHSFIEQNSFGTLYSNKDGRNYATHSTFFLQYDANDQVQLFGHISLQNEQVTSLTLDNEILCTFLGPHCYISPSWYTSPNVPTWNYKSVQVRGKVQQIKGNDAKELLGKMVKHFEANIEKPVSMKDIPFEMLNEDLENVFVFEVAIIEIEASFKLSQNKDEVSYLNIIRELKKQDDFNSMLIAFEMEQELKKRKKEQLVK
jgi:transcriptional regulator